VRQIADVIRRQLGLNNGRLPADEMIKAWSTDLLHRLGPIVPEHLESSFVAAREEAAERRARGAFGALNLDDVIRIYKRRPRPETAVPYDPYCSYCRHGHVMMTDPQGYETQVPCSCAAGRHQGATLKIYEGRHNVEELLRRGWELKVSPLKVSREETVWLVSRSERTSPTIALAELRALRESGEPLPPLSPTDSARAKAILDAGRENG